MLWGHSRPSHSLLSKSTPFSSICIWHLADRCSQTVPWKNCREPQMREAMQRLSSCLFIYLLFLIFWSLEMGFCYPTLAGLGLWPFSCLCCDDKLTSPVAGWIDLIYFTKDDALQSRLLPWRKQNFTLVYGWRSCTVYTYCILFMCSSTDGNLGWFQNMALVKRYNKHGDIGTCVVCGLTVFWVRAYKQ